jgi:hypothetical protein
VALFHWPAEIRAEDEAKTTATDEDAKDQSTTPAPPTPSADKFMGWKFGGSLRARVEWWDWFNPGTPAVGQQNEYAFFASYLRLTAQRSTKRADIFAQVSVPILAGMPTDATAPAPQGQLGLGAAYRAANGDRVADLWYSGGGAFQYSTFRFSSRPSFGSRDLGNLADVSLDFKAASKTVLTFYYGYAGAGKIIHSIYPAGSNGSLAYWELSQRF